MRKRGYLINKKKEADFDNPPLCGERGIRTPGSSHFNGFQDRRNRPLCHLSFAYISGYIKSEKRVQRYYYF